MVKALIKVTVKCADAAENAPAPGTYDLMDGTFTVGDVAAGADGAYTAAVTVNAEKYVERWNVDNSAAFTLAPDTAKSAVVTLIYKDGAWAAISPETAENPEPTANPEVTANPETEENDGRVCVSFSVSGSGIALLEAAAKGLPAGVIVTGGSYTVEEKKDVQGSESAESKLNVKIIKITEAGNYTISGGSNEKFGIEIDASGTVNLTLRGLSVDLSGTGRQDGKWTSGLPALAVTGGSAVITLEGENTLKSGANCAGLQNGTNSLTIKGEGSLTATGGIRGAGIGGGYNGNGSSITITGGTVYATGGQSAAGIGGGYNGNGSSITISGGTVTATCPNNWKNEPTYAAGIGGGCNGNGSDITITGGTVIATGGAGAGIGGGNNGDGENIKISGGDVTATSAKGAGIGGGQCGDGHDITITSGVVTVSGGETSADIGGGFGWSADYPAGSASNINVTGVTIKKNGGEEPIIGVATGGVNFLVIRNGKEITYTSKGNMSEIGNGDTVKLLSNVELEDTESITVSAGKNFTLDLNGFTISQKIAQTKGHSLLTNSGTLTIKDSSAAGTGKITYEDTGSGGSYVSNTITNKGTLNVESGTIENTTNHKGFPYAIDNQSGNSAASLTVTDGTVDCKNYSAIRLFCNSTTNNNSATISGGTIRGCVEYQQPIGAKDKALGSLTITDGSFERNEIGMVRSLYIFSYGSERECSGMSCSISDGTFDGAVQVNNYAKNFKKAFITGGIYKNGQYTSNDVIETFDNNPSNYVSENGTKYIVKRDGDADANYVYTVIPKSHLTDGVYLSDPSGALAEGYGVTSTDNNVWTVTAVTTYTVIYTDGKGGTWFTDEVHSNLESGTQTPAYNGGVNPTRDGYEFKGWSPTVTDTVTGNVTYTAQWESKSELLVKELLGNIKVECVSDSSHTYKEYDTSVGGYSAITLEKGKGKFTSTITVYATRYIEQYNKDTGKTHQLVAGEAETQTIVVEFDDSYSKNNVTVKSGTLPVTFKVTCAQQPAQMYTVTYTDGVSGWVVFQDQVYSNLLSGTKTPEFNGTPTRSGYTFAGWTPAFSATVTGDVTYTATWKPIYWNPFFPKTGDDSNLALWVTLLVVSGGAVAGTLIVSRRKKRKHNR